MHGDVPAKAGDYYPLTRYSQAHEVWMAYQLDRPDLGKGLVVALRRPESPYESGRFPLRGLDEGATYKVTNFDTLAQTTHSGKELAGEGLETRVESQRGSALLLYERQ